MTFRVEPLETFRTTDNRNENFTPEMPNGIFVTQQFYYCFSYRERLFISFVSTI